MVGFSNAPDIPFTSGYTSSGNGSTNGYMGYFASPMSTISATNALGTLATGLTNATNLPSNATATSSNIPYPSGSTNGGGKTNFTTNYSGGQIAVILNSTQTNSILRFDVPATYTNMISFTNVLTNSTTAPKYTNTIYWIYTNNYVTNLTIVGSTNANALHVVVPSSNTNLSAITLSGATNTRQVYINQADNQASDLTLRTEFFNASYIWWLGMTATDSTHMKKLIVLAPTNTWSLTIQGGIRSERDINLNQGKLILNPSTVPPINGMNISPVELLGDRIMWLEEQRSP